MSKYGLKQKKGRMRFHFSEEYTQWECITSFSQLELRVSIAIGLLGALLPVPGGMTWSPGWFGHGKLRAWLACLFARVVERYCFTCCRWACWIWYLVGFSRWVCTYTTGVKRALLFYSVITCGTKLAICLWHTPAQQHLIQSTNLCCSKELSASLIHIQWRRMSLRDNVSITVLMVNQQVPIALLHNKTYHLKSMLGLPSLHRYSWHFSV